ncbi:MAG TPA: nucleoside monophosphate kinase [Patescibacteria group bacterium]|nr:nucleoside monophosphate kinase [Patescibacteria group bacterium]
MENKIQTINNWLGTGSINIFGSPFAGKDTQGQRLAKLFHGQLIGGGDILRSQATPDYVKNHMEAGQLAPTEEYMQIVLPYLGQTDFTGKPLILSSVGRWHGEEEGVIKATALSGHLLMAVIFLQLSEGEVWNRWEVSKQINDRGKRTDDNEKSIKIRLAEFQDKTIPVIDFYRDKGLLIEINGDPKQDEVTTEIINRLFEFSSRV